MSVAKRRTSRAGFSLVELMIAVALMSIIVLALFSVFNQTQKAFRSNLAQVDVNEAARAALEMMARDLEQAVAAGVATDVEEVPVNLAIYRESIEPLLSEMRGPAPGGFAFHDLFYLTRSVERAAQYEPQGFFVGTDTNAGVRPTQGVGALYRFNRFVQNSAWNSITNRDVRQRRAGTNVASAFFRFDIAATGLRADRTNAAKLLDGIVLFRVTPCDETGRAYDANDPFYRTNRVGGCASLSTPQSQTFLRVASLRTNGVYMGLTSGGLLDRPQWTQFSKAALPAFLDLEIGMLEPATLETLRSIEDPRLAEQFLQRNRGKVQIFRQRIALRAANRLPVDPCQP